MNKKQYNNIIEHSLQYDCKNTANSLDTVRTIFNNMGVALPQGDIKEVYETVSTKNYMDWRSCTMQEAQAAANNGTAAIGISEDRIVVLAATDEEEPVAQTAEVMSLDENTSAYAVAGLEYYSYSYGGTGCGEGCNVQGTTTCYWVDDYNAIYVSLYGDDGLVLVGHSYVFLKVGYDNWIKTEFNTPGGENIKEKKANSKIYIDRNFTSSEVQYILLKGLRELYMSDGYSANIYTDGLEFFPIAGNFCQSILLAESYEGTNYGGYNFLTRNCLHYIKEILKAGYAYDCRIENVLENSEVIEPKGFIRALNNAVA